MKTNARGPASVKIRETWQIPDTIRRPQALTMRELAETLNVLIDISRAEGEFTITVTLEEVSSERLEEAFRVILPEVRAALGTQFTPRSNEVLIESGVPRKMLVESGSLDAIAGAAAPVVDLVDIP